MLCRGRNNASQRHPWGSPSVWEAKIGREAKIGPEAKIPHAPGPRNQNIKQKQYCNKFCKDFKNGPCQKIFLKDFF